MFGFYCRLQVSVFDSNRAVIRAAYKRMLKDPHLRARRKTAYKKLLDIHKRQKDICARFNF